MIEDVRPRTPTAGHFAKAVVGERVTVRAVVFKDGHDQLTGRVLLLVKGRKRPETAGLLTPRGNDEWEATLVPNRIGAHRIVVEAWTDRHATWAHKVGPSSCGSAHRRRDRRRGGAAAVPTPAIPRSSRPWMP